jgi:hypothetical protein
LETIATINRLIASRIERHFRYASAVAARGLKHLAGTCDSIPSPSPSTAGVLRTHRFARGTAVRATVGFVLKTLLFVKALFTGAEDELAAAIHAVQHFIDVHERVTPSLNVAIDHPLFRLAWYV